MRRKRNESTAVSHRFYYYYRFLCLPYLVGREGEEMTKKQRTRWIYQWHAAQGTFIRIGIVRNTNTKKRVEQDVIRYQVKSFRKGTVDDYYLTPDEAACLSAGLIHALGFFLREFAPYKEWRKE